MKALQITPYVEEGPQPLVREIPRGDPFPVCALGSLRAIVDGCTDHYTGSKRLNEILTHPLPTHETDPQALEPRALGLSPDAKALLFNYYQVTEKAQAPWGGGHLEHVKSFASKSPEHAARIAGVLTLWSDLNAQIVQSDVMADAVALRL